MPSFVEMQQTAPATPVAPVTPATPTKQFGMINGTLPPKKGTGMPPAGGGNNPTSGVRG